MNHMNVRAVLDKRAQLATEIVEEMDGATLLSTLTLLWRNRWLIAAITVAGTICVLIGLALLPRLYSSEATLELNFNKQETSKIVVNRQIASMDPGALVNGAAQAISSRANVGRAVKRLGLDVEQGANEQSWLGGAIGSLRSMLGFPQTLASLHEQRIEEILRKLKVTGKPHLYVLGVAYTDSNPETSANIANALVIEYLRSERLKDLSESRSVIQGEVAALSERLGAIHPRRLQAQSGLERIEEAIKAMDRAVAGDAVLASGGHFLTLAEPNRIPVNQKRLVILVMGFALTLAFAAAVVILMDYLNLKLPERWMGGL